MEASSIYTAILSILGGIIGGFISGFLAHRLREVSQARSSLIAIGSEIRVNWQFYVSNQGPEVLAEDWEPQFVYFAHKPFAIYESNIQHIGLIADTKLIDSLISFHSTALNVMRMHQDINDLLERYAQGQHVRPQIRETHNQLRRVVRILSASHASIPTRISEYNEIGLMAWLFGPSSDF